MTRARHDRCLVGTAVAVVGRSKGIAVVIRFHESSVLLRLVTVTIHPIPGLDPRLPRRFVTFALDKFQLSKSSKFSGSTSASLKTPVVPSFPFPLYVFSFILIFMVLFNHDPIYIGLIYCLSDVFLQS